MKMAHIIITVICILISLFTDLIIMIFQRLWRHNWLVVGPLYQLKGSAVPFIWFKIYRYIRIYACRPIKIYNNFHPLLLIRACRLSLIFKINDISYNIALNGMKADKEYSFEIIFQHMLANKGVSVNGKSI